MFDGNVKGIVCDALRSATHGWPTALEYRRVSIMAHSVFHGPGLTTCSFPFIPGLHRSILVQQVASNDPGCADGGEFDYGTREPSW